jgi:hypothetical protein
MPLGNYHPWRFAIYSLFAGVKKKRRNERKKEDI